MKNGFSVNMAFGCSEVKKIRVGISHGKGAREYQEDCFGFSPRSEKGVQKLGFTAALADGMGGTSDGAGAGRLAVSSVLKENIAEKNLPVHAALSDAVKNINRHIKNGGAAFVCAVCLKNGVYWCSLGDSRIYLFRNGRLYQLTEDSDYLNQLLDKVLAGGMSYEEASRDPQKDSLARYLGYKGEVSPEVNITPLVPRRNDKLLLCSDGVYNTAAREELESLMLLHAPNAAEGISKNIRGKNLKHQDNYTALVLEFI